MLASITASMSKLAEWRKRRELSQRALAKAANVSYVTVARLETGKFDPRLSTLRQLAKVLKLKVRDLLDD